MGERFGVSSGRARPQQNLSLARGAALATGTIGVAFLVATAMLAAPACYVEDCGDTVVEPGVEISVTPSEGTAPLEVLLSVKTEPGWTDSCKNEKVPVTSVAWDLNGDQVADVVGTAQVQVKMVFDEPGTHTVEAYACTDGSYTEGEPLSCRGAFGRDEFVITVE